MAKFKVKITEIYHRTVDIEADSPEQAYDTVDEMVGEGEIDLPCDGGDYDYERELEVNESLY